MTLSVCLIVKDEEEVLERCLSCLTFADEIVVVDTGSRDDTRKIAARFTDKIYDFAWRDDFAAARNYAFSKATKDLVMWLDADDVIDEKEREKFVKLKEEMRDYDMAFAIYGTEELQYRRERVFRREGGFVWEGAVHEAVAPHGRILNTDARVRHAKVRQNPPMRNLRIYQKIISEGGSLGARERYYYGRELYYNKMYTEAEGILEAFLLGNGWNENKADACLILYRCYLAQGEKGKAVDRLTQSFAYAFPKSEACCLLGGHFMECGDIETAIYWYQTATKLPPCDRYGGFFLAEYAGIIPCLQLCVLYDRLGDRERANHWNERAGKLCPNHPSYLFNKAYFEKK